MSGGDVDEVFEAQYNLRRSHPQRGEVYARYEELSASFRAGANSRCDVPYGPAPRQVLDIFSPGDGAAAAGAILVSFHGGYWRALDKSIFAFLAAPFVAAGWTVVLPNYTLAPAATIDEIVQEAREAVAWVSRQLSVPGRPLVVSGHSAGGHLTLMTILSDWPEFGFEGQIIDAGIAVSGLFDLEPLRHTSVNDLVRLTAESSARNSPLNLLRPESTPLLLAVGGLETEGFHGQSDRLAAVWRSLGNEVEVAAADGLDHFTILKDLADPSAALCKHIFSFLHSHCAKGFGTD
ncbi:MAG: alpha/beta hydrolase [Alphaproteobacteria bacterium]